MKIKDILELMAPESGGDGGTLLTGEQPAGQEGSPGTPNNEGGQANNPAGEGNVNQPGWLSGVAEEYREGLSAYQKPTDFVKEALTWKERSENAIVRPGEDATAEQLQAYRKAMGIPESADGYELDKTELMSDELLSSMKELYLRNNLSGDQAKAVQSAINQQMTDGADAIKRLNKEARDEAEASLKKELGSKYDQTIKDAQNAVRRFASEADMAYLTKTGLGNDAGLIKMLANIQNQIGGDSLLSPNQQPGSSNELKDRFPNSPSMWSN